MKNKWNKIMAGIALFCIILSMLSTWLMVLFSSDTTSDSQVQITPEQLQELIDSQSWATDESTSTINDIISTSNDTEETK